jgi:leucyl-tRNA synthetase
MQRTVADTTSAMDKLRMREAIHHILYSIDKDQEWYFRRAQARGNGINYATLRSCVEVQVRLLAPFAPFAAEEIWELLGMAGDITSSGWPKVREGSIDLAAEESEFLISSLLLDLQSIAKVTKIVPNRIVVYTSAAWKRQLYVAVLRQVTKGKTNFGELMKQLLSDPQTATAKSDPKLVQKVLEDILATPLDARNRRIELPEFDEASALRDGASLVSSEYTGAEVLVHGEQDAEKYDPKQKSKFARPFKPAIYME